MIDFGTVKPGTTLYIPFATYDSNDPTASVTTTGLAVTDIEIYKDGSVTQRASDAGYTLLDTDGTDFDTITGIHGISIDLADNTTAGFYAAGSQYWVILSSITVDAGTINGILATFRIGYPDALLNTTIATLASQTSFTLTSGPAEDNALKNCIVAIHDVASSVQMGFGVVSSYTGSTKTVTLTAGTTFTAAATDNIAFYPPANVSHIGATAQTANDNGADINTLITEVAKVPKSDGTATWNATALASINAEADTALSDYAPSQAGDAMTLTAAAIDAIYDEAMAGHLTAGTVGLYLAIAGGVILDSTVTGTPTGTEIQFTGGSTTADFYQDKFAYVISGTAVAQGVPILNSSYSGGTTTLTFDETWKIAAVSGDRIIITIHHVHPVTQISSQVMTALDNNGSTVIDELTTQGDTNETKLDTAITNIGALNNPTAAAIAAAVYTYNMGNGRTIGEALAFLRNKWTISGSTLTVYDTDDTTVLWTSTVVTTAGDPVSSSDPA